MNNSLRIIDANLNRISEGIRVLEDHFRFAVIDKPLNEKLRNFRHIVRDSMKDSDLRLISSRESLNDNGLSISMASEIDKKSSQKEFILANFKRIEEAVRSVEENLHLINEHSKAKIFENIRFGIYELEKQAVSKLNKLIPHGIYGITAEEYSSGRSNIEVVKEMVGSGIKIIQYREKEERKSRKTMLEECREIRKITKENGVMFIVNDFLDIAILTGADGIHCGQDDLSVADIRKLSADMTIGISTHSPEQAQKAVSDGADYLGVGPIFKTGTKKNVCDPVGLEYLDYVVKNISIPFVAIGGIKESNIVEVLKTGARTISLVTEITGAVDIEAKVKKLNKIIENYNKIME